MPVEIERKFLLCSDAWRADAGNRVLMRQGYVGATPHCSVRVRVSGDRAWLNLKAKRSERSRLEYEYPIPLRDADEMLAHLCERPLVEKYRYEVRHGAHTWEIDEFLGENAGLIVAEIELASEDERFERPAWLGEEVTHDERYYNFNLAKRPYRTWDNHAGR
ncbi:MAG TPA: CYTH domain-containing protein [Steroidobacteraceae bacterium]